MRQYILQSLAKWTLVGRSVIGPPFGNPVDFSRKECHMACRCRHLTYMYICHNSSLIYVHALNHLQKNRGGTKHPLFFMNFSTHGQQQRKHDHIQPQIAQEKTLIPSFLLLPLGGSQPMYFALKAVGVLFDNWIMAMSANSTTNAPSHYLGSQGSSLTNFEQKRKKKKALAKILTHHLVET